MPAWEWATWEANKLLPSLEGRWTPAWEANRLLPSLEGRWAPAWEWTAWEANRLLPSLEGRWAPAWEWTAWEANRLLPSLEGRWVPACLPVWEATKFWEELTLVIFPSFLFSKLLNLFSCPCLTLVNLISPTFSMKPWHSLSLCVDKIDANCDLHSSVCLPMFSRILFIALTLAWSKSFSAFLTIFLAFPVFKVDYSLILTGIKSICIHLKVKNHWEPPGLSQGQRPYGQPKCCHLLVPMWWPRLWWGVHRQNLQDLWWKIQRAPEGPLSHSSS